MNLRYETDPWDTPCDRFRTIVRDWHDGPRTPMGRLYDDYLHHREKGSKEIPATAVRAELHRLLANPGPMVQRHHADLEAFLAYMDREAERERCIALIDKAVRQTRAAGLSDQEIADFLSGALTRSGADRSF